MLSWIIKYELVVLLQSLLNAHQVSVQQGIYERTREIHNDTKHIIVRQFTA